MSKITNSAMLLDIENFLKQQIAANISTCPSRIKILSIGCIDKEWSHNIDKHCEEINEEDLDESVGYEVQTIRRVKWCLSYSKGGIKFNGNAYTAILKNIEHKYNWPANNLDSMEIVSLYLDKDEAKTLFEELTELSEVNLQDAQESLRIDAEFRDFRFPMLSEE